MNGVRSAALSAPPPPEALPADGWLFLACAFLAATAALAFSSAALRSAAET